MTQITIRPCPFQDGIEYHRHDVELVEREDGGKYVLCKYCMARGPVTANSDEALRRWNRR
jgi:hypothetical protein